jgi:hypothetical protein
MSKFANGHRQLEGGSELLLAERKKERKKERNTAISLDVEICQCLNHLIPFSKPSQVKLSIQSSHQSLKCPIMSYFICHDTGQIMTQLPEKEMTKDHTAKPFIISKNDTTKSKVNGSGQIFGVDF